ncbi:probable G-protein coupled receptor 149 [Tachysurus fulvidraco]|uniref:probable G-protein coupled receptor 149 n=1 Tax=Tachysurus fulvidraco TaxID=1234273 RepID=UPI000F4FC85D|nr:probable G-protein coupled receptor 149 [Tachysurus fulvidraco]
MSPTVNKTNLTVESRDATVPTEENWHVLFGACLALTAVICAGGLFSLVSLLRTRSKSAMCLIVASLSADDLICVVPLCLSMVLHWRRNNETAEARDETMCTLSGLLYIFQGLSSNIKACLVVAYALYATKRIGAREESNGEEGNGRRGRVLCALTLVWVLSLAVSVLPLCGWGRFARASLGCLPHSDDLYAPFLFSLYALCACGVAVCAAPLAHRLLCSAEELQPSAFTSLSRESLDMSFSGFGSHVTGLRSKSETCSCSSPASELRFGDDGVRRCPARLFAQKRFSLILAMARVLLWMPMMTQILVSHIIRVHSSSVETLCFFLTLLSAAVTPVFCLSERWIHLPCGCFINCGQDVGSVSSAMHKRRFEFNLSFQQGYGIYKIPHTTSPSVEKPCYSSLYDHDFSKSRVAILSSGQITSLASRDFKKMVVEEEEDCSLHGKLLLDSASRQVRTEAPEQLNSVEQDAFGKVSPAVSGCDGEDLNLDSSSVFDGPERRLSHEECRKIELTDWEWCRSKSERTPRQRSAGGLAIPLCAFQGTVSLQAPTGKTLSLSTYEVSSDGLRISPTNAKKVEVYRSKSVGHEPSADEPNSGCGGGGGVADTNVKIHLEVLEICDNEEAMDSVSIVSNISQSSTHARSPSLRYSRRENRFVSCELGETASYSLLIPGSSPDADGLNIHIPDTVEAHRQNSRRQRSEAGGYHEEIQLLNEVYKKQEGELNN